MNARQKAGMWAGITLMVIMGTYPPWKETGAGAVHPLGYAPIYRPPVASSQASSVDIDMTRLFLMFGLVGLVTIGLISSAGARPAHDPNKPKRPSFGEAMAEAMKLAEERTRTQQAMSGGQGDTGKAGSGDISNLFRPTGSQGAKPTPRSASGSGTTVDLGEVEPKPEKNEDVISLNFPAQGVGELHVESADDPDYWDAVGSAKGSVQVPPFRKLHLELSSQAANLSLLSSITLDSGKKPRIHSIDLSEANVRDDDLAHLKSVRGLQELDLSDTNISAGGLAQVSGIESLKKLWLDRTQVSASDLAVLEQAKNLKKVSLVGTALSEADIDQLKRKLPGCQLTLHEENES